MGNESLLDKKWFRITVFSLFGMIILLLTFSFVYVILLSKLIPPSPSTTEHFQYFQYNPSTNETSFGFTSTPFPLSEKSKFHVDIHNNHVLFSKVGSPEYTCTGSCYCREDDTRRFAGASVMSRGLVYLLTAFSVTSAISIASNYFNNECRRKYSDECSMDTVSGEVEKCVPIYDEDVIENSKTVAKYLCKGSCLDNTKLSHEEAGMAKRSIDGCSSFSQEAEIHVELIVSGFDGFSFAKEKFKKIYLDPFCPEVSKKYVTYLFKDVYGLTTGGEVQFCESEDINEINPTIICRFVPTFMYAGI